MQTTNEIVSTDGAALRRLEFPFDALQPGFIVSLPGHPGLQEALGALDDGRWVFRGLNLRGRPLTYASSDDVRLFKLPIFHCYASRKREKIVILVSGDDYDVTREDNPFEDLPLFQEVHAGGLVDFAKLAADAGFTRFEITNGYAAISSEIQLLIEEVERQMAARLD